MARTAPPQPEQQAPPTVIIAPSPVAAWPSPLTDKKTTEQTEKKPRKTAGGGVPMGPTLVGASNATAMAVTGAFELAGPVGAIAAGGVMAVGATAAMLRRRSAVKRSMASRAGSGGVLGGGSRSAFGGGSGSGRGAFGGGSRGASGGGSTASRSGSAGLSGGGSRGGSRGATGTAGTRSPGSVTSGWGGAGTGATGGHKGKHGGKHGGHGGGQHGATNHRNSGHGASKGTNLSPTLKAAKDRTNRHGGATDSKTRKTLAALGSAAGAGGRGAKATGRGLKAAGRGASKAWKSKAGTAVRTGTRKTLGAALDGGIALAAGAWHLLRHRDGKGALARLREVWRRRRDKRKDKADAKAADAQTTTDQTLATTVRRPTSTTPIPATFGGTPLMSGHHFVAPAMEMARIAANYNPTGMLQVGEDFVGLAEALRLIAESMKITVENADVQYPLAPQIVELLGQVHGLQLKAAELADELKPAFESLHQVDLDRLRNPRKGKVGETMWDASTNL